MNKIFIFFDLKFIFFGRSMDMFVSKLRKYLSEDSRISIENIRSDGFSLKIDN